MTRTFPTLLLALATLALTACNKTPEPTSAPTQQPMTASTRDDIGKRSMAVCSATVTLHNDVTGFLDAPSEETLSQAQLSWTNAHNAYRLLADDYRLADLTPPQIADSRDPIDAWPLLPGYLDQVPGYPRSGLVYSEVPMTPDFLAKEHQSTDFYYLTEGFHPLEFMLWGNPGETLASQAAKFSPSASGEDELDIPGRRRDLTRLLSNTLKNTSAQLCTPQEQARLVDGLTRTGKYDLLITNPAAAGHEPAAAEDDSLPATGSEETGQ